jgi:hypothetical protein
VPSLSLFGLGALFVGKAVLGDRLDLSALHLVASTLVLPGGAFLLLALVYASRALPPLPRGWARTAALIALLAPAFLLVVLSARPPSADEGRSDGARPRLVVAKSEPLLSVGVEAAVAAERRGYCLNGVFYDLVAGQPSRDPAYRGAVPASVDPSTGAVSCAQLHAEQDKRLISSVAPRRGYCLAGVFYDLVAGQPSRDPAYRGAVLAPIDPSTGAVSCNFPP